MDSHPNWRLRARAALEVYFRKRSNPRLVLSLIVIVAGLAGFFISHGLLKSGLETMCFRYPIAVIGGYVVFLGQLRIWVEMERRSYDPREVIIKEEMPGEKTKASIWDRFDGGDPASWLDLLDLPGFLELDEGCLLGCAVTFIIGLIAGAATITVSVVMAAPELLAEMFLDAVVITVLYRHLKTASREHWLGTAVRRTWNSAFWLAAVLGFAGLCLQGLAPERNTMGAALKEIFGDDQRR